MRTWVSVSSGARRDSLERLLRASIAAVEELLRGLARARFVGRREELGRLDHWLDLTDDAPRLVWVSGPGGTGKTSLARMFAWNARSRGHEVFEIAGEHIQPTPHGFEEQLAASTAARDVRVASLGRATKPSVLVVDSFERIEALLGRWLVQRALPSAGTNVFVLLCARTRPDISEFANFRSAGRLHELLLGGLTPEDAEAHARALGMSSTEARAASELVYGHPLAIDLLAARGKPVVVRDLADAPSVVDQLATMFLRDAVTDAQREGLRALATCRALDEELLVRMTHPETARATLDWLRRLPFVEPTAAGFSLHPIVRDVVFQDLVSTAPSLHARLAEAAIEVYLDRFAGAPMGRRLELYVDALFTRRRSTLIRERLAIDAIRRVWLRPAEPRDRTRLRELIHTLEGAASAATFDAMFDARPDAFLLLSTVDAPVYAVVANVPLDAIPAAIADADPMFSVLRAHRARLPSSGVLVARWFFHEGYQAFGPAMTCMIAAGPIGAFEALEAAPIIVCVVEEPSAWEPLAGPFGLQRAGWGDFAMNGRRMGVFVSDMRDVLAGHPQRQWSAVLVRALLRVYGELELPPPPTSALLTKEAFQESVRQALSALHQPVELGQSLLVDSAWCTAAPGRDGAERLAAALLDVVAEIARLPGHAELHDVLRVTFVEPQHKQQAAAAELGIPFGTYRYRLRKAMDRVGELAWRGQLRATADRP